MNRLFNESLTVVPVGKWAGVFRATLALLLVFLVPTEEPAEAAGEATDLVFLVDGSGSISATDFQLIKSGLSAALQDAAAFPRDGSVAVGLVQWSFIDERVEVPLTVLDSQATVNAVVAQVQAMAQLGSGTNPGDAIRAGTDLLLASGEAPAATKWILCMSTDGTRNGGESLASATAYAASNGVDKYAVIAIEDPQSADAVRAAAEVPSGLGAQVKEISLPLVRHTGAIVRTITHTERLSLHPEWLRERPQDYHPNTRVAFMAGNLIPAQVYYKAQKLRAVVRQQVLGALEDVDLLIQPTSSGPAAKINLKPAKGSLEQAKRALVEGSFRGLYSPSGAPALSILCGFTSPDDGGLPLASQIAGRPFDEATVLRVAHAYEQNTSWHTRRPPI